MSGIIITNNPMVNKKYENTIFIEGTYLDVLNETKKYIHTNHKLLTHPIGASARMNFSPYISIAIGEKLERIDERQLKIIESSIENHKKYTKHRNTDLKNGDDYKLLDLNLLESSFNNINI